MAFLSVPIIFPAFQHRAEDDAERRADAAAAGPSGELCARVPPIHTQAPLVLGPTHPAVPLPGGGPA
jgi:hypothetical protein